MTSAAPARPQTDAAIHGYARRYGDALRVADAAVAERVIDDALSAGMGASAIQSLVIAPGLNRVGELWEANLLTVADEHLATAISHAVLIKLFDQLSITPPRTRERILLAGVQGQHHVLGLRMVADVLEGAGFEVLYLGADVPVDALSRFAAERQPAITGLTFSISGGVGVLAESILAVHEACPTTRIMLGGQAVPDALVEAGYRLVDNSMDVVLAVEQLLREPSIPDPPILGVLRRRRPAATT